MDVKINIERGTEFRYQDGGGSSAGAIPSVGKGLRRASPGGLACVVLHGASPELSALRKQSSTSTCLESHACSKQQVYEYVLHDKPS